MEGGRKSGWMDRQIREVDGHADMLGGYLVTWRVTQMISEKTDEWMDR